MNALWAVFSFSFVVALSGAMAPGPLLTYTVIKTMQSRRRGYLVGAWIIAGHALLETALIVALLLGFSLILKNPTVLKIIGVLGGLFLVFLGLRLLVDVARGRVRAPAESEVPAAGVPAALGNPVLGGALVSMSNPYWWIWWATIGFAFMIRYQISFTNLPALFAFLIGHEAGDLAWYLAVSTLVYLGRNRFNMRVYNAVLFICGCVMVGFGLYLGLSLLLA
jgi:threonine/homoserine/homoserine lactone efflux protein